QALEKDPAKRHPNVRVLRAELRELVDEDWGAGSGQFRRVSVKDVPVAADFAQKTADSLATLST
ncbi:unnamed protein product, partial [marine sediment metagenome]